jgi:hypothetical protein
MYKEALAYIDIMGKWSFILEILCGTKALKEVCYQTTK